MRRRLPAASPPPERLQKLLARTLSVSRRTAEQMIADGRIQVDGEVAVLGSKVSAETRDIRVDGRRLRPTPATRRRVIMYHKPDGEECSRRPSGGRKSVFDALPPTSRDGKGRWIAVGRLDVSTSGLLLLTTDGAFAHRLMHPSGGFDREYMVRLDGSPPEEALQRVRCGVQLDDGPAAFADLVMGPESEGRNRWCCVTLLEGRNRLIHRIWATENLQVSRLMRVRFGPLSLPRSLRRGQWRELSAQEIAAFDNWPVGTAGANR